VLFLSHDIEAAELSRPEISCQLRDRHTVNRQSMQTLVDHYRQFVDDALTNQKLMMKFTQDRRDVVKLPGLCCNMSCGVLNSLQLLQ